MSFSIRFDNCLLLAALGTLLAPLLGHHKCSALPVLAQTGLCWRSFCALGRSWGGLGVFLDSLGPSWSGLGPSWAVLGPSWGGLGPVLGGLGAVLEPIWSHLGLF